MILRIVPDIPERIRPKVDIKVYVAYQRNEERSRKSETRSLVRKEKKFKNLKIK